jgi:glycosyltransferase involved in cell wall biosynthesis
MQTVDDDHIAALHGAFALGLKTGKERRHADENKVGIGTEVGGIPDLILEGKTGFLLPQEVEPSHVAAAILRFAALNDEQKRQMSDAARKHWEQNFNAVRNAEQFTGDLLELVSK